MKRLALVLLVLALGAGMSLAAGGKNHGEKGKGMIYTGNQSSDTASQKRAGR